MLSIIFRDKLPDGCPLDDLQAEIIRSDRSVFHFVQDDPEKDFQSQRTIHPDKEFKGADECIVRGISVFETFEAANAYLESHRSWARKRRICQVDLSMGAGAMLRTHRGQPANTGQHWTWWPARDFDITSNAHQIGRGGSR